METPRSLPGPTAGSPGQTCAASLLCCLCLKPHPDPTVWQSKGPPSPSVHSDHRRHYTRELWGRTKTYFLKKSPKHVGIKTRDSGTANRKQNLSPKPVKRGLPGGLLPRRGHCGRVDVPTSFSGDQQPHGPPGCSCHGEHLRTAGRRSRIPGAAADGRLCRA